MKDRLAYCILIIFGADTVLTALGNLDMDISKKLEENGTILSRKRRYLVFPEGSSFQVVFDLTYPSVGMGNAFVFGNTAAMGFQLPSTPIFLDKKKMSKEEKEEKPENKTTEKVPEDLEHQHDWQPPMALNHMHGDFQDSIDWPDPDEVSPNMDSSYESPWTNIDRSPVTFYTNPFGSYGRPGLPQKSTVGAVSPTYSGNLYSPTAFWNMERPYESNRRASPIRYNNGLGSFNSGTTSFRKTVTHHLHRRSRRDVYTKIEKLFTALSKDGKACMLKTICQVNKIPKNKGSMWEEILKAIFKVKPHYLYPDEDHYDAAADLSHDCDKMYPECEGYVLGKIFRKKSSQ